MRIIQKYIRGLALLFCLGSLALLLSGCKRPPPEAPYPPGVLRILYPEYLNLNRAQPYPPGIGTPPYGGGLAFDGNDTLYYTVDTSNLIMAINTNGSGEREVGSFHTIGAPNYGENVIALAYDSLRDGLWIGGRGGENESTDPACGSATGYIWFKDLSSSALAERKWGITDLANYDASKTSLSYACHIGALEHDPVNDTLWTSEFLSTRICQISNTGEELSFFDLDPRETRGIAFDGQSLWLGSSAETIDEYSTAGAASGTSINTRAVFGLNSADDWLPFGIAYDGVTFSPKCVLWVNPAGSLQVNGIEKFVTQLVALEISCP